MREAALSYSDRARRPGLTVLADGAPVRGAMTAHVVSTNHAGADRFRVRVALSADAAMGIGFWGSVDGTALEIRFGLGGSSALAVEGLIDRVDVDAVRRTVTLDGRDRTAALIEARTTEAFANRTSSEIASLLAGRHGLTPDVAATSTPVGRYWQLEHDRVTLDRFSRARTEWDLLVSLAAHEAFDVWVRGTTLFFQPRTNAATTMVLRTRAGVDGPANVTALRLERALTLARDIEVSVKSWNSKLAKGFTQTARATRQGRGVTGEVLRYAYVVPDLLPDAALALAQRTLRELSQHERVIEAEMPGDLTLDARACVRVAGTDSEWDQDYVVDEVTRSWDAHRGFQQTVRARNVSNGVEIT